MFTIPSPLHPAIVHFPIVLILIGTVMAIAAIFIHRWHLPWLAAGLLLAGSLGGVVATWTGGNEAELAGELSPQAEQVLEQHEEWGERTRNAAVLAAILAIGAVSVSRFAIPARVLSVATAVAALGASYCVAETGHYGGQLVYKYGVGVNTATSSATAAPENGRASSPEKDD